MAETYEVIVVGGGFAGIEAATKLGRAGVRTLLVDVHGYHQFQPLLYQLATAQIGVSELARPLRSIFRRQPSVRVLTARVAAVDPGRRTITLTDGTVYEADDALIVACGAEANFFDTPGARENAYPLYSATDATRLGSKLVALLDQADKDTEPKSMNVAVVGAGPTGVETAGAIADAINYVVPKLFAGDLAKRCSVALVDMVDRTLGGFSKKSQAYAASRLVERGVRLKLGSAVTEVREDGLSFADGATMDADLVIWAGGLKAGPLLRESGMPQGRGGRIDVAKDLTVPGYEGVYVLGDAANITDDRDERLPQLGSVAKQSGGWAARNILAQRAGRPTEPFGYKDRGYMAMIGRGSAVAELGRGRRLVRGPAAFLVWLAVHLALLSGASQKARALVSWIFAFLSHSRQHVFVGSPEQADVVERTDRPAA
ncbi:NAD(P)/FAD-dependent oxidoreductase [Streptomyces albidoflavus]|uniref:Pyridine nucleotide-disulfide oxidoreductase n=1 Tax=Streptomyces albidoflavus TaxID=1886 RepID=A0AA37FFE5_9ACTN|nr:MULTISPECIES: NAD(P)/FAD-dependent oxidoreductase [Streptomyces]AMM09356.1 NADH dehydrogenase [Streptomyces albidoflavus]KUL56302.1 NADH dehydrogenase [Streptomyces albidoflavus]MBV7250066.1 NAD(P)/FAD-dependent oxidoreductase [Streptomyces sp. S-2]RZE56916.1 NAD(P)/FAD-dependent oxidoreductase [Streptomyces albidoflavus]RZE59634.1 NAD(P)/FAD-dependent oxidoreductase [Streptomyces albidoflavus]